MILKKKIVISKLDKRLILLYLDENDKLLGIKAYGEDIFDDIYEPGLIINAKVEKKLNDINSCFIRLKDKETGYLNGDYKCGSIIPVMYKKNTSGNKKPLYTDMIALSGKLSHVTYGGNYVRVSSRIDKNRAKELREAVLNGIQDKTAGIVIRTAAADKGVSAEDIIDEINELYEKLCDISAKSPSRPRGHIFYMQQPQIISDCLNYIDKGCDEIITDDEACYKRLSENNDSITMPVKVTDRVKLRFYSDELLSLDKLYSFKRHISECTCPMIHLDNGADIVIDKAEALWAVDVNSARLNLKNNSREEAFLDINKEAFKETYRQVILRNMSGIIMIDFINMTCSESYDALSEYIKEIIKSDGARSRFFGFTALGLAEFSRRQIDKCFYEQLG